MVAVLWGHVPLIVLFSVLGDHEPWHEPILAVMLCWGATLLFMRADPFRARLASAATLMAFSGMLIHLNGGRIEYHFHVFTALAFISLWNDWRPVWLAGGTIAVHHVALNVLYPFDVFAQGPGWFTVFLHALFVVLECSALTVATESARRREVQLAAADSASAAALAELKDLSGDVVSLVGRLADAAATAEGRALASAERTAAVATQLEAGAREQADAVRDTAADAGQVKDVAAEAEIEAGQVAIGAAEVSAQARSARGRVDEAGAALHEVRTALGRLAESGTGLGTQVDAIAQMTAFIADVADQARLLSLNAAIEAARAGEQGRGFVVVAGEIRRLADRSQQSVDAIAALVTQVQTAIRAAVADAEGTLSVAGATVQAVDANGSMLEEVLAATGDISDRAQRLGAASAEVGQGGRRIEASMHQVTEWSTAVAAQSAELRAAAAETARTVDDLADVVRELAQAGGQLAAARRTAHPSPLDLPLPRTSPDTLGSPLLR